MPRKISINRCKITSKVPEKILRYFTCNSIVCYNSDRRMDERKAVCPIKAGVANGMYSNDFNHDLLDSCDNEKRPLTP